ncbi:hypothetical protein DO73_4190 [Burkholderia pseudomallei]|nr:hypothetical protein DO73_4190 [Burkholderia pseudomallei]
MHLLRCRSPQSAPRPVRRGARRSIRADSLVDRSVELVGRRLGPLPKPFGPGDGIELDLPLEGTTKGKDARAELALQGMDSREVARRHRHLIRNATDWESVVRNVERHEGLRMRSHRPAVKRGGRQRAKLTDRGIRNPAGRSLSTRATHRRCAFSNEEKPPARRLSAACIRAVKPGQRCVRRRAQYKAHENKIATKSVC